MFLKLFFIKKHIFVFKDSAVSFAVVFFAVLMSFGLQGYCSQGSLRYSLVALIALCFGLPVILAFATVAYVPALITALFTLN